jgi:predicted ATPase
VEAIAHLSKGLELLQTLPATPERAQQELTLQIARGGSLQTIKGYAAPEVGKAYAQARELCQQVGETPQLYLALLGLWTFYIMRADLQTARELAEQLLRLAQRAQDPARLQVAHYVLGETFYHLGEFPQSQAHLEHGIALYNSKNRLSRTLHDPGVACLSLGAITLWALGYTDRALKRIQEALSLAHELSHPFSLAYALHCAVLLHELRQEVQAAQERIETLMALSIEQRFMLREAAGTAARGWVLAEQGQKEEGIAQMCQGMAAWRATGAELARPRFLALLAEVYGKVGRAEEGLPVLADALATVQKNGEHQYEAELYRLKGELTLQQFNVQGSKFKVEEEAEECFLKAIEIARKQQAKSLELRAVMSLARLWQQQGKRQEAHKMLAEIYQWFTEGFDTKDLQEAKELLEELA